MKMNRKTEHVNPATPHRRKHVYSILQFRSQFLNESVILHSNGKPNPARSTNLYPNTRSLFVYVEGVKTLTSCHVSPRLPNSIHYYIYTHLISF